MKIKLRYIIIIIPLILIGCSDSDVIDSKYLIIKNGVYYKVGENRPFTGKTYTYNERKEIVSEKHYKNGKLNGPYIYWYNDGHVMEGNYKDGIESGTWTLFDENGNEISHKNYN